MQIVIEISEEMYQRIMKTFIIPVKEVDKYLHCIKSGTPLPEHHGRLIIDERGNIFEESTGEIIL